MRGDPSDNIPIRESAKRGEELLKIRFALKRFEGDA